MAEVIRSENADSWQPAFAEISNALPAQELPGHMPYASTAAVAIELPERVAQSSSPATAEEIQAFFEDIFR